VEVLFKETPKIYSNNENISFVLVSNKGEAMFEYSSNGGYFPAYTMLPLGHFNVTVRPATFITPLTLRSADHITHVYV